MEEEAPVGHHPDLLTPTRIAVVHILTQATIVHPTTMESMHITMGIITMLLVTSALNSIMRHMRPLITLVLGLQVQEWLEESSQESSF